MKMKNSFCCFSKKIKRRLFWRFLWKKLGLFCLFLAVITWNTVKQDWENVSKWLLASTASVNLPPNICIPNREKMKMNRKRITSKELIDEIELTRDFTKLPIDAQYLKINCAVLSLNSYPGINRSQN